MASSINPTEGGAGSAVSITGFDVPLPVGSNVIGKVQIRNSANSANIDPLAGSDYDTLNGGLTETAPASDTASSGLNGRLQRVAQNLTTATTAIGSPVQASDFDSKTGSLTESAPATDTASSGLNGRLQRIAQRITSMITTLGSPMQATGGTVDVIDRTARDNGKVDISGIDINVPVVGTAAQGVNVSGNPVLSGAEARDTLGTVVATGNTVRFSADRYGRLQTTRPASIQHASSNGTPITSATNTSMISAPGVGTHLRVWRLHVSNSGATGTWIYLRDGAGGTKYYPTFLPQNGVISIRCDGGFNHSTATAANLNTSAAGNVEWHVEYETVAD